MDLNNSKVSIGIVIAIIAQAFGIIWYVAQLDSTVDTLDTTVSSMKEEATTIDVAVLQTDVENLEKRMDSPATSHSHDQQQHSHNEFENIQLLKDRLNEIEEFLGYLEDQPSARAALPPSYDAQYNDIELYRLIGELEKRLEPESIAVLLEKMMDDDWRDRNLKEENSEKSNDTDIDKRIEELWVQIDHLNAVTSDASGGAASWRFDEITDKISQLDKDIWELHGHE